MSEEKTQKSGAWILWFALSLFWAVTVGILQHIGDEYRVRDLIVTSAKPNDALGARMDGAFLFGRMLGGFLFSAVLAAPFLIAKRFRNLKSFYKIQFIILAVTSLPLLVTVASHLNKVPPSLHSFQSNHIAFQTVCKEPSRRDQKDSPINVDQYECTFRQGDELIVSILTPAAYGSGLASPDMAMERFLNKVGSEYKVLSTRDISGENKQGKESVVQITASEHNYRWARIQAVRVGPSLVIMAFVTPRAVNPTDAPILHEAFASVRWIP